MADSDQGTQPVAEQTPEQRLSRLFGSQEPEEQEAPEQATPQDEEQDEREAQPDAESDELTADDLPDEDEERQEASDTLEITWNGQRKAIPRAEAIDLAQKGLDYTQKTQRLAEERQQVAAMAQHVQQTAQMQQQLLDDVGNAKALQRELERYPQTPQQWSQKAQDDPLGAFQLRTEYDALFGQFQQTLSQIQQKSQAFRQGVGKISAEQLAGEFTKLTERVPEWRDHAKYQTEANQIREYLRTTEGYQDAELDQLTDSRSLAVARKAWKYDQLVRQKGERIKQVRSAPPVAKPGNANSTSRQQTQVAKDAHSRLKKTGDLRDAAAVLLTRKNWR